MLVETADGSAHPGEEQHMSTETTSEIRIEDLEFEPPSAGSWELDLTHYPRPAARFVAEPPATYEEPMGRGFIESLRRYGLLILHPEYRFVHGFAYRCIRPAPEEEIPERIESAARAFETKLWREDLRVWDEELKPVSIRAHRALQAIDPRALDEDGLLEHLAACYAHLQRMFVQHYRLVAPVFVPGGDFLVQGSRLSGVSPAELLVLMRGSAPISAGAEDGLDQLAASIRDDRHAASILESDDPPDETLRALRSYPGSVGTAASEYLQMVECRLVDGFEVGCPCAFELPELLVKAIRSAVAGTDRDRDVEEARQRVLALV